MVIVKLLVEGGKMTPGPAIAQQLGPMGLNLGKIISDVNEKTSGFKGMNVPVSLNVNPTNKSYTITVMSPPVSELLKKEAGLEKGSGNRISTIVGNLAFEQIISVAKQKHDNMLSNELLASIKSVLGTCQAMGLIVDSKQIKEVLKEVAEGNYNAMIKAEKVEVDSEKKKELQNYFNDVKAKQDAMSKAAAEAAAAAEAEKVATTATTPAPEKKAKE